jgi:hypothetical protein
MGAFRSTRPPDTVAGRVLDFIGKRVFDGFPAELLLIGADQTLLANELDRRFKDTALLANHRVDLTKLLEDEFKSVAKTLQNEMLKWSVSECVFCGAIIL